MPISSTTRRGGFFDFIYIMLDVIGTCMQIFKNIDLKKTSTFFIQSCSALFLMQTVLLEKQLVVSALNRNEKKSREQLFWFAIDRRPL